MQCLICMQNKLIDLIKNTFRLYLVCNACLKNINNILRTFHKVTEALVYLLDNIFLYEPRHEKTGFCICENKDADQLCDQRLCFR